MTVTIAPRARALGAAVLAFLGLAATAAAADTIGNCEVQGQKGQFAMEPARPGQLTVEVNLPAPGWWNGARARRTAAASTAR